MNELIRELVEEAGYGDSELYHSLDLFDVALFVKLIVQECADLIASRPYIDDGNWPHPSKIIKEHFGLEGE